MYKKLYVFWVKQERQLEYAVIEILEAAGGFDYIASFARHRITIETLCQMTEEDLQSQVSTFEPSSSSLK